MWHAWNGPEGNNFSVNDFLGLLAGYVCVVILYISSLIPYQFLRFLTAPLLIIYQKLRNNHGALIEKKLHALPCTLTLNDYYWARFFLSDAHNRFHAGKWTGSLHVLGEEHYFKALKSHQPIIAFSLHFGPFEPLQRWLHLKAIAHAKSSSLWTASAFSPPLTNYLQNGRSIESRHVFTSEHALGGLKYWLKTKGMLAVLIDEVPVPSDYLHIGQGLQIPWASELMQKAHKRQCICIPTLALPTRMDSKDVSIQCFPPLTPDVSFEIWKEQIEQWITKLLMEYPEYYNWSYKKIRVDV